VCHLYICRSRNQNDVELSFYFCAFKINRFYFMRQLCWKTIISTHNRRMLCTIPAQTIPHFSNLSLSKLLMWLTIVDALCALARPKLFFFIWIYLGFSKFVAPQMYYCEMLLFMLNITTPIPPLSVLYFSRSTYVFIYVYIYCVVS